MGGSMILVSAAGGNQGKRLLPKLASLGCTVRALRRSAHKDNELLALGAKEVIVGDASNRTFLQTAMKGVDTVYHVGPSAHPLEREMGFAMIDIAREMDVGHFIYSSVLHPTLSKLIQHRSKRDIEEYLIESGVNYTVLQPSDYMMPLLLKTAFDDGVFELSFNLKRRQAMIDLDDLAEVASKTIMERRKHFGATYELSSPGAHSADDIAQTIARVTGRTISTKLVSPDKFLQDFFTDKNIEAYKYQSAVFQAITQWYNQHDFPGNSNILEWLLERPPTTLEEFITREWNRYKLLN
jgi:uncharacterized protein YbjT (DUF2867 family)